MQVTKNDHFNTLTPRLEKEICRAESVVPKVTPAQCTCCASVPALEVSGIFVSLEMICANIIKGFHISLLASVKGGAVSPGANRELLYPDLCYTCCFKTN